MAMAATARLRPRVSTTSSSPSAAHVALELLEGRVSSPSGHISHMGVTGQRQAPVAARNHHNLLMPSSSVCLPPPPMMRARNNTAPTAAVTKAAAAAAAGDQRSEGARGSEGVGADEQALCEAMEALEGEAARIAARHADAQRRLCEVMKARTDEVDAGLGAIYRAKFWNPGQMVVSYPATAPKPTSICGLALDQGYDATPTAEALARERVIARGNCAAWCLQQDARYQVCVCEELSAWLDLSNVAHPRRGTCLPLPIHNHRAQRQPTRGSSSFRQLGHHTPY